MADYRLAFTPAFELARMIRKKEISPVEVLECFLARIRTLNPQLHAFLTVTEAEARNAAVQAERAVMGTNELPPLHGVPIAIKDLEYTKGIRTTMGSLIYKDFVPEEDSISVARLRAAGAIIVGKTNTPEFGLLGQTMNLLGEDGRNPWDPNRTCGGSSGGSAAAVAAGMVPLATGTDSAGSINNPANLCGVVGMKPSLGRIPCWPVTGPLLFKHNGPITRTVRDTALMLQVTSGYDRRDPMSLREPGPRYFDVLMSDRAESISNLKIGWSPDLGFATVDAEVASTTAKAAASLTQLGCRIEETKIQLGNPFSFFEPLDMGDRYVEQGHLLEEHADKLHPSSISEFKSGAKVTLPEYVRALKELWAFRAKMADLFEGIDLLITPANPVPAYPIRNPPKEIGGKPAKPHWSTFAVFRVPWNITGYPVATVPCGWSSTGLPIGMLLIGRAGCEDLILRVAAAFESAYPWAHRMPAIAKF